MTDTTKPSDTSASQTAQTNPSNEKIDYAGMAAESIAAASVLSKDPEALANAFLALKADFDAYKESHPEIQTLETAAQDIDDIAVRAIPKTWLQKVDALIAHAESTLGFREQTSPALSNALQQNKED